MLDTLLIYPFRLTADPVIGFYLGTAALCLWCALLGEITGAVVLLFNQRHHREQLQELIWAHNLSLKALGHQDKQSYTASNKLANDLFGKVFFAQVGLFASTLWPAPFALGWLQERFSGLKVPFVPFTSWEIGYVGVFVALYVIIRILVAKVKMRMPFLAKLVKRQREVYQGLPTMRDWTDLHNTAETKPDQTQAAPPSQFRTSLPGEGER